MDRRIATGTLILALVVAGCGRARGSRDQALEQRIQSAETGLPILTVRDLLTGRFTTIEDRLDYYRVPGLSIAVVNDFQVEWARGYGVLEAGGSERVTPETLFQPASIGKALTAAAALHHVETGDIDLDEHVNDVLLSWKIPENEYTAEEPVTLRRLLSHRAGVTVPGFFGYAVGDDIPTLRQMLDGEPPANNDPVRVDAIPDEKMRYSGGGYLVVQQLLEDVAVKPYSEIAQETVLTPAGMEASRCDGALTGALRDTAASAHTAGGVRAYGGWHRYPEMCPNWTTATDLARFAIELMRAYTGQSEALLSQEMAREMLTAHSGSGYGLGMYAFFGGRLFFHPGDNPPGYKTILIGLPRSGRGLVMMTNGANGDRLMTEVAISLAVAYGILPPTPYLVVLGFVLLLALVSLIVIPIAYLIHWLRLRKRGATATPGGRRRARFSRTAVVLIIGTAVLLALPNCAVLASSLHSITELPEANRGDAPALALVEESLHFARRGEIGRAIEALAEAQAVDPELELTAGNWSDLCVLGSLWGSPEGILDLCEQGVASVPDLRRMLFGRGLARALTANYDGAVEDFEVYVEWTRDNGHYDPFGIEIEGYVAELREGQNPFNQATLVNWR